MQTAPAGKARLDTIDLLRFVAALSVMLFHFTTFRDVPAMWYGRLGVNLFFMISGFVILMSAWGRSPAQFAASRVARLYPAYWFSVALCAVLYVAIGLKTMPNVSLSLFATNLTMLQVRFGVPNINPVYWTLAVELQFYLIIGALTVFGATYRRCIGLMIAWMLLSASAALGPSNSLFSELLAAPSSPYFIAGMSLYLIHRFGSSMALWSLVVISWAEEVYIVVHATGSVGLPPYYPYVTPVIVTAIFGTMALVATRQLGLGRMRRLGALGVLTYPLYLIHLPIGYGLALCLGPQMNRWAVAAISIVISLSGAYLVYRLVEQPTQGPLRTRCERLLHRLGRLLGRPGQVAVTPAAKPRGAEPLLPTGQASSSRSGNAAVISASAGRVSSR